MAKYIKRPIPIEAIKMDRDFVVETLEGTMKAYAGDYLCTDHRGNKYPCRGYIFEEIYEEIIE